MSVDIDIVSYRDDGTLVVSMGKRRYKYYDVPPFQKNKVKFFLEIKDIGAAVRLLKRYSRKDLFIKHGYSDHKKMEEEVEDDG